MRPQKIQRHYCGSTVPRLFKTPTRTTHRLRLRNAQRILPSRHRDSTRMVYHGERPYRPRHQDRRLHHPTTRPQRQRDRRKAKPPASLSIRIIHGESHCPRTCNTRDRQITDRAMCHRHRRQNKNRRSWADFCELQGLPRDFNLPEFTLSGKYRAVGNGVHIDVARTLAKAIQEAYIRKTNTKLCICNCGRPVTGKQRMATPACRKRMQKKRDALKNACRKSQQL